MSDLMAVLAGRARVHLGNEVSELLHGGAALQQRFPDGEMQGRSPGLPVEVTSVAPMIATAIRRNHYQQSLADLRAQR